jgi:Kef-type K+ transport system membrane component KefB
VVVLSPSDPFAILIVLLPASIFGLITKRLGFSSIIGYVIAGAIVGPILNLVDVNSPILFFLGQLGIVLITFQIGLTVKLDFIKKLGNPAGIVIIEIIAVMGLTFLVSSFLDLPLAATYVLAFMALNTSTAVVFHLMEEEKEFKNKPIRDIVLGVGAFEDILSIIGLALLPAFTLSDSVSPINIIQLLFFIAISITLMIIFAVGIAKHVIHYFGLLDKELLVILSMTLVIAYAFVGEMLGLSSALGAFVAGLAVSCIVEAKEIEEKFLSFTDVAALFFFASIGASLPMIDDLFLVISIVGISLLMIFIKFFSFSLSSWLLGSNLENSFKMGLYMLVISEFGIIIASEAYNKGVVSEEIYLVSVLAMVASTIIASTANRSRDTIAERLASLLPKNFRNMVEVLTSRLRDACILDKKELENVRIAADEILKRGAIVTLLAFIIGGLSEIIPNLFGKIAPIVEGIIITVGSTIILITLFQSKDAFRALIRFSLEHRWKAKGRMVMVMTDTVHFLIVGLTALILILFYSPFIERLLEIFLSGEISKIIIVLLLVSLMTVFLNRIYNLMKRIDNLFKITE